MGYYINENSKGEILPSIGKVEALIADGAIIMSKGEYVPDCTVCVVNNGAFEAAAYAHSEQEFNYFMEPDGRPKIWLMFDKAKKLAK